MTSLSLSLYRCHKDLSGISRVLCCERLSTGRVASLLLNRTGQMKVEVKKPDWESLVWLWMAPGSLEREGRGWTDADDENEGRFCVRGQCPRRACVVRPPKERRRGASRSFATGDRHHSVRPREERENASAFETGREAIKLRMLEPSRAGCLL